MPNPIRVRPATGPKTVTLRMVEGHYAPARLFVSPNGDPVSNRGCLVGTADGFNTITVHKREADVLMSPDEGALDLRGKPLIDADGNALKNSDLIAFEGCPSGLPEGTKFEIVTPISIDDGVIETPDVVAPEDEPIAAAPSSVRRTTTKKKVDSEGVDNG